MAAWAGTAVNMTIDGGGALLLDEGASYGTYTSAKIDATDLDHYKIVLLMTQAQDGAGGTHGDDEVRLMIRHSEDDATWTKYFEYTLFSAYLRYYQIQIRVASSPCSTNRPKITSLEHGAFPTNGNPWQWTVQSILAAVPANPDIGDRHLINAGADSGKIVVCQESDTPTFLRVTPREGMEVHDENTGVTWWYRGAAWRSEAASETRQGIVELAGDGEVAAEKAVQGNDARLANDRDPTAHHADHELGGNDQTRTEVGAAAAVGVNIGNAALQTVLSHAFSANDLDDSKDRIIVGVAGHAGAGGSGAAAAVVISWDGNTIWAAPAINAGTDFQYVVEIWRSPVVNTDSFACDANQDGNTPQVLLATLDANWMEKAQTLLVQARSLFGVTDGFCSAQITCIRCP